LTGKARFANIATMPTHATNPVPFKACRCGASYSVDEWEALPLVGVQQVSGCPDIVLRNCDAPGCNSTLALEMGGAETCPKCGRAQEAHYPGRWPRCRWCGACDVCCKCEPDWRSGDDARTEEAEVSA